MGLLETLGRAFRDTLDNLSPIWIFDTLAAQCGHFGQSRPHFGSFGHSRWPILCLLDNPVPNLGHLDTLDRPDLVFFRKSASNVGFFLHFRRSFWCILDNPRPNFGSFEHFGRLFWTIWAKIWEIWDQILVLFCLEIAYYGV